MIFMGSQSLQIFSLSVELVLIMKTYICMLAAAASQDDAHIPSAASVGDAIAHSSDILDMSATPADTVKKRRRTASWKIGANGPIIVSIADKVGETRKSSSRKKSSWNHDNAGLIDVDIEEEPGIVPGVVSEIDVSHYSSPGVNHKDASLEKTVASWKDGITGIGQEFKSVVEFRDVLQKYAIANRFMYRLKKNDTNRASGVCIAEGCSWLIHASWVPSSQVFRIKKMNKAHTCGGESWKAAHPAKSWLVSIIKDRLRDSPHHKPKDIATGIFQDFGLELNYTQVWRGIEEAREQLQGSYKEAYTQLPWFCDKMAEANPGSFVKLCIGDDNKFQRLFVSFHASIHGFKNGCRPLVFLDSTALKSKFHEVLLMATAIDGNDGAFPVSFAIVDIENDDNWHWFLVQLKSALSSFQPITFVGDRQMGLRQSIVTVFQDSFHSFCLHNLSQELKDDLKGPHTEEVASVIVSHLYDAAQAATLDGFRKCIDSIKSISPEAFEWILQSEPEHWANSLFEGSRYHYFTSSIGQSFYSWVNNLPVLPVVQIVDTIRQKLMELIYTRKAESDRWSTRLTPSMEDKLQKEILKAQSLQVSVQVALSPGSTFEVHDCLGEINVVNIDACSCSCRTWQLNGFPCYHAVVVLQHFNRNLYDYCSRYYTTESFQLTYSEPINPVPTTDKPVYKESSPVLVHPPPLRRLAGPPKQRRIRSKGVIKRPLHCSKCKGAGHNRATCHVYS